jgi:GrpB-like predicted nucleotidyltransferase (UPF0157 family)
MLERVLVPWLASPAQHIGSTAIPGLAAKPILDMVAGVHDLAAARQAVEVLQQQGYAHGPHRPHEALWFFKPASSGDWQNRTHHLHLTQVGSNLWRERIGFRDALRRDRALLAEYQSLKARLAAQHGDDLAAYTRDKRAFVRRVLASVGIDLDAGQR